MTQEQCDRYNNWVDAYNRVANASNSMSNAHYRLANALNALRASYKIDGSTNDNGKLSSLCSDISDRVEQMRRVVLPYIDDQLNRIKNE